MSHVIAIAHLYQLMHAGAPRNLRLSIEEMMLKVDWNVPQPGVTNERIQSYVVACSFVAGNDAYYTLKHPVSVDVFEAFLPIGGNYSTSAYNCCVEAAFETYSSKACIATSPSQLIGDDNDQQLQSTCPSYTLVQAVAGALTSVIVILLLLLLVAVTAFIYMWRKAVIQRNKEEYPKKSVVKLTMLLLCF